MAASYPRWRWARGDRGRTTSIGAVVQTAATRRPTKFSYVPALDGLRGVLVLPVALFHFSITAGWEPTRTYAPGSFFAPSTFFALSGYLITSLLLAERERTGDLDGRGFWSRRFRRLLPASVAVIVAASVLTALFPDLWGPLPGSDVAAGLFSLSNWQAIALADAAQTEPAMGFRLLGPLGVFWSLSLEEQFYLGLFTVIVGALAWSRTRGADFAKLLVALLVVTGVWSIASLALIDSTLQREFFGTDTRASELVAGCLLAVWVHHRGLPRSPWWGWVGLAAMLAAVLAWSFVHEYDEWVLGWGLAAFSVVNLGLIVGASVEGPMSRILAVPPLVWFGRLSYPIYLAHWPMALIMNPDRTGITGWPLIGLRSLASVAVAWVLFRWFETPVRTARMADWPRGLVLWGVPASSALLLALVVSGWGWA